MAITTDSYVTINGHSVGLSKVISQVTLADVEDVIYSGYLDDKRNCNMLPAGQDIPLPRLASTSDSDSTVKVYHIGEFNLVTESSTLEGQLYFRNVLLYVDSGYGFGGSVILYPDTYNAWHIHFITEIDIQEIELVCNPDVNVQHTAGVKYYGSDVTYGAICVAQVIKDSNDKFIIATLGGYNCDNYTRFNSPILYNPSYDMYYFRRYNYPNAGYLTIDKSSRWCLEPNLRYSLGSCAFNGTSYQAPESLAKVTLNSWGGTNFFDITMNDPDSTNYIYYAWSGLRFTDGTKHYKPIVEDGYITGYTDDDSVTSEFDEWENISDHTTPATPPSPTPPTPSGDEFDDHAMGAGTGISGMANLWLLTASQLSDLHTACSSAPVGFDPLNSFISVMGIATNPEYLTHEIQYITPINIRMSDGTTWQTHVEGHIVDSQVSAFSFTGITVQRKYNNFLDFSPYATHEIFVPMCGWITLPDIAVDRSITVTYIPDIESLKCRAVVSVVDNSGNKCVIGEKDGIMGADVPFTNIGHSLFVGDAIVNGAEVAGEAITMAIGAGFTKTNAKGGTYRPYEGFTLGGSGTLPGAIGNALVSGNLNRTHFMTGNGTRIGFSDGENIQIKSVYHNVDIPPNYPHTVGLMCNKTGELSEFTGFTVCDNPHITFSALEAEKEEIKRLLEEGVIL